jgi:hypothetical protein
VKRTLALALLVAAFSPGTVAIADGGNWFELRRHRLVSGEVVHARASLPRIGRLAERTHLAYLVPVGRLLRPGPIPPWAVRLGVVGISVPDPDAVRPTVAELMFVVPDVPAAPYTIQVCDVPCRVVGLNAGITTFVTIGATATEARLVHRAALLRGRTDLVREHLQRRIREVEALSDRVERLRAAIRASREEVLGLRRDRSALLRRLAAVESGTGERGVAAGPFAWAVVVVVGLWALVLGRWSAKGSHPLQGWRVGVAGKG